MNTSILLLLVNSYFNQFFFQVDGSCQDMSRLRFYFAQTIDPAEIGRNDQGQRVQALMSIQLFPQGTYWATYSERAIAQLGPEGAVYDFVYEEKGLEGTWSYDDKNLVLSDLGYAVPSKYEMFIDRPYPSFKFKLNRVIHDPRAQGAVMNLIQNGSDTGPRGQYVYQYCRE